MIPVIFQSLGANPDSALLAGKSLQLCLFLVGNGTGRNIDTKNTRFLVLILTVYNYIDLS